MKFHKVLAIAAAAVTAGLLVQSPAIAAGNAHKYPPTPPAAPKVPATPQAKAPAAQSAPEVVGVKSPDAARAADAVAAQPSTIGAARTAEVVNAAPVEKAASKPIFTSRYEPLAESDALDSVAAFNRGRSRSK